MRILQDDGYNFNIILDIKHVLSVILVTFFREIRNSYRKG